MKRLLYTLGAVLIVVVLGLTFVGNLFAPDQHSCYNRKLYVSDPPLEGADVEELQLRLRELGFYTGQISGIYDQQTADAVRDVQRSLSVEPSGEVEVEFWPLLYHGEQFTQGGVTDPPPGEVHIEIYLHKLQLTVFSDGDAYATFPISPGMTATPSPMGEWRITDKSYMPNDAFGTRWMRLSVPWGGYGIHGTNAPWSIGRIASLGCIRMYNDDVELIYPWIPVDTRVRITGDYDVKIRPPISQGQMGQHVVLVQWALREAGFCPGEADGRFDKEMDEAVKQLQMSLGLQPTGIVDDEVLWLINLP